ncbi:TolC family protein [Dethiosulfovibrio sp. F2B]|uniref:TolC family protein n=1 Tax=Dethiosulfovibrio faecalis TaxID=2720018 RepID=UPI001F41262D|nr:TolC family protein [Dethiosulfovibrio faecalis]MCF4152686.1 TolC family protein [Dethiosulfovibrio faecalis]
MSLKYRVRLLGLMAVALTAVTIPAWGQELLTVDQALQLAYDNNPTIMASSAREEQARQSINEAEAANLPHLGASLAAQFSKDATTYPVIGGATGVPNGDFAMAGYRNAYQAALTLNWLLYSSGSVSNTVRSRELAFSGVEAQSVRTGQSVENGVKKAYYDLQRYRAKLTVAQESLELAREHLSQVESFYKYGVVAKDQVLRVQVDVSDGKLNVIKAENAVDVGWRALERAVGTTLRDEFLLPEPETSVSDRSVPEDPVASAMVHRPELASLEYSRRSALSLARAAAGSRGPQVALQGQLQNVDDSFFPGGNDDWKVTLSATWAFYDGGASVAQERQAKASAQELLYSIEDLKKQIVLEISSGKLNIESALQRIEVAQDQVASAEEDYRMALKRYTANVGTNIDVLDARVALSNARTQLVDAVYDTYTARSDLEYAMGASEKFVLKTEETQKDETEEEEKS